MTSWMQRSQFSTAKRAEWGARLARFARAKQTVAEFCLDEGVSQPSFYQRKKRLTASRAESPANLAKTPSGFQPVQIVSPTQPRRQETIIRLGQGIQIELGSDLAVVEVVVNQLLASARGANVRGGDSC